MMRNLKALGLLAFAVLAMGAMFASAAQAQTNGMLTAGHTGVGEEPPVHTPATIIGTQYPDPQEATEEEVHEWETWNFFEGLKDADPSDRIECDTATLTGTTATGTETDLKVEADYTHCRAEGTQDAVVRMNGCKYTLEQPTKIAENEYTGTTSLTCPVHTEPTVHTQVEVDIYLSGNPTNTSQFFKLCTIKIGPKPGSEVVEHHTMDPLGGHIIYKNIGRGPTGDHITAAVTVEGIYNDATACGGGASETGTYTSTVTIEARNDDDPPVPHTESLSVWLSDEEA